VVRKASEIGMLAGGDFIKTSTGKVQPAATPAVTLVMLEAIRDTLLRDRRKIGMKPAGGIRTAKQALHYLVIVKETLGDAWLDARPLPLRRLERAPERRAHAARERAHGELPAAEDFSKD
jgi:deoxyribose-phosphate aldolase